MWSLVLQDVYFSLGASHSSSKYQKFSTKTPLTILARDAGEFANDAFGGQDFTRLAMEVTDPMLRDMAMAAFKPSARPYLQLALFAPDWTISNLRVAGRAIPAFNANERNRNLYMTYLIGPIQ